MKASPQRSLFNQDIDQSNENALLEQYKLYVESANLTSRLRSQANSFFLTLNTILISLLVALLEFSAQAGIPAWILFAGIAGVLLDFSWLFSIRSYRALNSGRFAVIQELELKLPANVYAREWNIITDRNNKVKRRYIRQTYVEQIVPIAFGILYISLMVSYFFYN